MKPIQLKLTEFGPFKGSQVFRFPAKPGLYFLWGRNDEEPQLEANGAGKSKLWDALTWLFYGKTGKGLKAGDVSNWEAGKGTAVELVYLDSVGAPCRVRRTWSPNSWTYECSDDYEDAEDWTANPPPVDLAKKDADNPVLDALRLEFLPWLHSILMAQGMPMFLDLGATEKAALFAEVMQLDCWLDYSQRAAENAKAQDRESRRLESLLSNLRGRAAAWEDDVEVAEASEKWKAQRDKRLDALASAHSAGIEAHKRCKADAEHWAGRVDQLRKDYQKRLEPVELARERLSTWEQNHREVSREAAKAEQASEEADRILATLKSQEYCPTCDQKIDRLHIARHKAIADEAHTKYRLLQIAEEDNAEAVDKYRAQLKDAQANLTAASDDLAHAERTLRDRQNELGRLDRDLDDIEDEAERLHAEINPYEAIEARQKQELADLRAEIRRTEYDLDESLGAHAMLLNWVRWFKEIRLQLIGDALQQLEIEVNSCLAELGLLNWELRFDIDKESKSGSIQRGFSVTVISPHNERAVPWEAWSGGESQRLRLGAQQGLGNLIRNRSGTGLDLEVWDEPTQWLSPQGVQDLLESLRARAEREKRQIWIVDHRTLGFSGFSGQVGVIKTPAGSKFIYP